MKTHAKLRHDLKQLQKEHEKLGDAYLEMCRTSNVEPLPVAWQTIPPNIEGETFAYVITGDECDDESSDQPGFDVHAPREQLAEAVFLKVFSMSCRN